METGTHTTKADLDGRLLAGRYRLGSLLGRGGMADVYHGIDERLERAVAVKVLRPELAAQPDMRRRFEIEARAAAGLSHPNIVAVFDTGEDHDAPFIVMERLPGDTVADRILAGPAEAGWLRAVAGDVLGALSAAHDAGLVHRDVKPGNILIAADGCAKVTDFGIAKTVEEVGDSNRLDLTATNLLLGTPAYLAPERIDGESATPRSDLYSLGVVLYEAAAGVKPFEGATSVAVAHAAHGGEHAPLREHRPDLDPELTGAIERAMARDPVSRFASARDMAAAFGIAPAATPTVVGDATTLLVSGDATAGLVAGPGSVVSWGADVVGSDPTEVVSAASLVPPTVPVFSRVRSATATIWQRRRAWVLGAVAAVTLLLILVSLAPSGKNKIGGTTATTPVTGSKAIVTIDTTTTTAAVVVVPRGKHGRGKND